MITQLEIKKHVTPEGVKVFAFLGELDETNVDSTFPAIISDIGGFENSRTLFDFSGLQYLNSKSIGYIADISQRTEEVGGKFALCSLSAEVHDTLDLVGITSILPIYGSEAEAVATMIA